MPERTQTDEQVPEVAVNPISSVLVANRGEIARRVFRTCRDLGLATVAVYSDADETSPHAAEADAAVRLVGNTPSETYLRADLIIEAARRSGADAIHPGYGFLSENAAFAQAVLDAGLTWIGPPVQAIESMGSKIEAKAMMAAAGVPVLAELAPDQVTAAELPVIIKASAGGGGRGMRVVHDLAALAGEIELAASEAGSAFGDPTVFCEPYLAAGRHIEVQVMADAHGTVWAVGERECSIQRRHQKIVEEAPSPLVERTPGMREALFGASVAAAKAIGYVGAGTVEFLADEDGRFFFLEMNTRLQVEHPVTECTTGLDLVEAQIAVASGDLLAAEPPPTLGHSIEVRLYAEDPSASWQPQSGTLHRFSVPGVSAEFTVPAGAAPGLSGGLRLDSGVVDGSVVGIHYDPMLAKLIAWAPTRSDATRRLLAGLRRCAIHGITTNRDLLVGVLSHPDFVAGNTDTAFLDRNDLAALAAPSTDPDSVELSALAATLADVAVNRSSAAVLGGLPSGWRNVWSQHHQRTFRYAEDEITVRYMLGRTSSSATAAALTVEGRDDVELVSADPNRVVLVVAGIRRSFSVAHYLAGPNPTVHVDSPLGSVALQVIGRFADPADQTAPGSLLAPMPGSVIRLAVSQGERVEQGQVLLWLEAMKMQHEVRAPAAGVVSELAVAEGEQVDVGAVLAVVQAAPGSEAEPEQPSTDQQE